MVDKMKTNIWHASVGHSNDVINRFIYVLLAFNSVVTITQMLKRQCNITMWDIIAILCAEMYVAFSTKMRNIDFGSNVQTLAHRI